MDIPLTQLLIYTNHNMKSQQLLKKNLWKSFASPLIKSEKKKPCIP